MFNANNLQLIHYVYHLIDPRDGVIRYVGAGRSDRKRYWHGRKNLCVYKDDRVNDWIRELRTLGLKPVFVLIADDLTKPDSHELEIIWIARIGRIEDGGTLLNISLGGAGRTGGNTSDTRRILSEQRKGKKLSLEHRRKLSEAHKGIKFSDEHCRKIGEANSRRVVSDETRQKISEKRKQRVTSDETRHKMSESRNKYLRSKRPSTAVSI